MNALIKIWIALLLPAYCMAQNPVYNTPSIARADSLLAALRQTQKDSSRMQICAELAPYYFNKDLDSSLYFGQQSLSIAKKLHQKLWQAFIDNSIGYAFYLKGGYVSSLQFLLEALKISSDEECERDVWGVTALYHIPDVHKARLNVLAYTHLNTAFIYSVPGNVQEQAVNYLEGLKIGQSINDPATIGIFQMNLTSFYMTTNKLDSALLSGRSALDNLRSGGIPQYTGVVMSYIGDIYQSQQKFDSANAYYKRGVQLNTQYELYRGVLVSYRSLSRLFLAEGNADSAIFYANKGIDLAKKINITGNLFNTYNILSSAYNLKAKNDSAYFYLKRAVTLQDSLYNRQKISQFQDIGFNEQFQRQQEENQKIQYQNKIRTYLMLAGIIICLLTAFFLYRNNRSRYKANVLLHQQKEEIEIQKKNVETTLAELKAAQSQLIQSEKMASLGELTAGIAHEIQNPLNFVNNFSDVNNEMIDEMKQEIDKGNYDEVKLIADNIKDNEQKINHHGKRADAIVKGMLQHSRTSTGMKESTDINALCDEYLRLAYHGLRAKEKDFNTDFKTDFDESVEKIDIVPQDIGRVLLNLINNAFYAVDEKRKSADSNYKPVVTVKTGKAGNHVFITVRDNGNGIPGNIIDKIFQPFFTTKPTGQGTGLGLSLSYDIIKAHGGEIRLETKEGDGTEFIIQLPLTSGVS